MALVLQSPTPAGMDIEDNDPRRVRARKQQPKSTAQDLAESISGIQSALGPAPTIQAPAPVAQSFAETYRPQPVQRLGSDFFSLQKQQLKDQLRQEFFGPLGTVQQVASQESAAGRLGSGVGKNIIQETAMRPFQQGVAQIDQQILSAAMEETVRANQIDSSNIAQFNSTVAQLISMDSTNQIESQKANAELQTQYTDLTARLADAKQGRLSAADIARLDSDTKLFIASMEAKDRATANAINFVNVAGQFKPEQMDVGTVTGSVADSIAQSFGQTTTDAAGNRIGEGLSTDELSKVTDKIRIVELDGRRYSGPTPIQSLPYARTITLEDGSRYSRNGDKWERWG